MRRNQILDAARHLLFASGIDKISISKISKASELGVGTIYFYYKNKEEIFAALQEEGLFLLYSSIDQIANGDSGPDQKLCDVADAYYRFSREQKNYFDIINYFLSSPTVFFEPDLKHKIDRSGYKILLKIRGIIEEGVETGVFKEDHPQRFSIMFWGTLHGLIQMKKLETTILENESHEQLYAYSVQKLVHSIKY